MKKVLFSFLLVIFAICTTPTVVFAADKTYSSNNKLKANTPLEKCVIEEGVTLDLNGRGLEIGKSLTVKKNGRIIGNGVIIFDTDSTCEGITLYYMVNSKYRALPLSIKELAKKVNIRPQFVYVKKIDAYCYTGDGHKPTNWSGNPFDEDFNKEKADKILANLGKLEVSASLCEIDKVNLSWEEKSSGKDYFVKYKILYKNATAKEDYQELAYIEDVHEVSVITDKLSQSSKYTFKFIPVIEYYNNLYEGEASYCSIYTLGTPKIKAVAEVSEKPNYVMVSWGNLISDQESGYEIRISKDKSGKDIYKSIDVAKGTAKSKSIKVTNEQYYYSVRAYKVIEDEKVYTKWSKAVLYELGK